jgi:cellulose biosynthesis protein BcsQ
MAAALPRYAVWNNKGGVGKTFVTFVMAAEYAGTHPDQTVVVIDVPSSERQRDIAWR